MNIRKILFIQKQPFPYFGVLSLAAMLENHGYEVAVIIDALERSLVRGAAGLDPDLVCITAMSMEREWAARTAAAVKKALPRPPIVLGGVHAILYSEDAIRFHGVDYACNSEGEDALLNLIHYLKGDVRDPEALKGIWLKDPRGDIIRNPVADLAADISQYAENRGVYYKRYPAMQSDGVKFFLGSRGCPYQCTFCFNSQMRKIFKNSGRYIRFKRPERLLQEIELEKKHSGMKYICFSDDLFTMNKEWLRQFSELYKKHVNIPFMCQVRVEFATEEVLRMLREAGCTKVMFGLETGSEELRATVLNKKIGNDDIRAMVSSVKKMGMQIHTFNIFGIPTETLDHSFETIDFNVEIGADMVASSMCIPFPGTALADLAIRKGYLSPQFSFRDIPQSFHRKSVLQSPLIHKQEKVHKIAAFSVKYPRLLPFIKKMIASESVIADYSVRPFFFVLFLISFLQRYRGERNTLWDMIKFVYRFRKSY